jgi:flagellar biosynthesis/type III secretory pathway protein FliH
MSDKYYSEIEVTDEGEYWETGNEQNLREIFARYTEIINLFAEKLEQMERVPGESTEELVDRIEQMAKEIGEVEIIRVENPDFKSSSGSQ